MDIQEFDKQFLQEFENHGKAVREQYQQVLENYRNYIIPFQTKRMKQNQSLSFKNTQLQRQKFRLLKQIEQLSAQGHRQQYVMKCQTQKINNLQNSVLQLDSTNNQNLNKIQILRQSIKQLQASGDQKIKIVKQVQQDKQQVLKNCEGRNKQYEELLQNYLRDKNAIAEKLNYMNQLEQGLKQKQKKIQQHQFYLKKQWEKFQQAKKQLADISQPASLPQYIRRASSKYDKDDQQPQPTSQKNKYERVQILRTPIKKLIKYHNNQIYDVSFNYSGNMIATCGGDRAIKIYDVINFKSGVTIQTHSVDSIYLSLGLDYSGQKLLTGSSDRSVQVFSTSTGKQLHCFVGHGYKVNSVSWTSAKQKCVSGSQDKQIKVWEIQKASNLLSIPCKSPVKFVSCNTIQPVIHSGHSDGSIRLYSLNQTNTPIAHIKDIVQSPINSIVVLSNRSQVLVSTQQGSPIYLIDLKMNKLLHKYSGRQFSNGSVRAQLSPSQKYVVAGNYDGSIYYWNKDNQKFQKKITQGHQCGITTLKYHFMSSVLVSCDKQGNVTLWQ